MVVFAGLASTTAQRPITAFIGDSFAAPKAYSRDAPSGGTVTDELLNQVNTEMFNLVAGPGKTDFVVGNVHVALFYDMNQPDWFENYHVVPRSFDFGNILSTQTSPLVVFSGYRKAFGTWSSFVNNAGAGTTLLGVPALPAVMNPLQGYEMTLEVSTNGVPSVDDDLAFVFDFGGTTISVPITLNRIVLFPVRPELPYIEKLEWNTDVIPHADGSEQRISVRKNPRQFYDWDVRLDDGEYEKARMDSLMYDWQSRTWGVPVWHEATYLTVAATAGDLTINVGSTADADYRVGGLAMVYTSAKVFDVQVIDSLTATTITFENALLSSYDINSTVAPLRTGVMRRNVSTSRYRSGDQTLRVSFRILDNDTDIDDLTGWTTHNSKIVLDDCNVLVGDTLSESLERDIYVFDSGSGLTYQDGLWDKNKHSFGLTLSARNRADLWNFRQLLHALRGRQISFYMPTFGKDLLPTEDILAADQEINVENIGYTQFVRTRQNKNRIWLRKTDGTTFIRVITGSTETSSVLENLALDAVWGADIDLVDIDRISYLEEVRFNSDELTIRYERGDRLVRISAPVITTFD